jgi:hypothetical protein
MSTSGERVAQDAYQLAGGRGSGMRLISRPRARVMGRVRPPRLTALGRAAMIIYVVTASATAVWLMRDASAQMIIAFLADRRPVGSVGRRAFLQNVYERAA